MAKMKSNISHYVSPRMAQTQQLKGHWNTFQHDVMVALGKQSGKYFIKANKKI